MLNWKCFGAKDFAACLGVWCWPRFLAELLSKGVFLVTLLVFWSGVADGVILHLGAGAGSRDMFLDLAEAEA